MEFQELGLIDYEKGLALQESLVAQRFKNEIPDQVLFCSHNPVVTLGRSTQPEDISGWKGLTFEVRRGGRATYHGPNQLIIYPIISLDQKFKNLRPKDVMHFLASFEKSVLNSFFEIGFENIILKEDVAFDSEGRKLLNRGLWCEGKKVAAFGIAVRRWVTYHGCAINLYEDKQAFQGIQPCGYKTSEVGNLDDIQMFDEQQLVRFLKKNIKKYLS